MISDDIKVTVYIIIENVDSKFIIPHGLGRGIQVPFAVHVTTVVSGTNPASQTRAAEESTDKTLPSNRRPTGMLIGLHSKKHNINVRNKLSL